MWSAAIRRRKEALRLVATVGTEVSRQYGKSKLRQLFEVGILALRGYTVLDYYFLNLYEDYTRAWKFMTRGQFDNIRRKWNPPVQGVFEFNKWIFGNYCTALGIPTPRCYGVFDRQIGFTAEGHPLRDKESLSALLASVNDPVVFKPIAGTHGHHIMVSDRFDSVAGKLTRANKQEMSLEELYGILTREKFPWLIQAKVRQHPVLSDLHETSLNTTRIITLLRTDGNIDVLAAVFRIGVGSAEIDNTHGGGIVASIDPENGTCGPAVSQSTIRRMARHPDTGHQIEGFVIPQWNSMKEAVCNAHRRLPFARSLGWDVALSESGPVIVEVNATWYLHAVQMTGKSLWETAFAKPPAN